MSTTPRSRRWAGSLQPIQRAAVSTTRETVAPDLYLQPGKEPVISTEGGVFAAAEEKPASLPIHAESGLTLIELIVVVAIVSILATAALPIARFQVKREKERELRRDLWTMRDAIDHYKDAADKGAFVTKLESFGYPPDLDTLVNGVDVQDKKVKFLRKVPVDPMTGTTEWGFRSNQDDPDSQSFGGQNVFDVYSKSQGTALDGTKYSTW